MPKKKNPFRGQGFDWNPQNINRDGQPKRGLSFIMDQMYEQGVEPITPRQLEELVLNLLNMEENQMKAMFDDPRTPAVVKICLTALWNPNNAFNAMNVLLDRAMWRAANADPNRFGPWGKPIETTVIIKLPE